MNGNLEPEERILDDINLDTKHSKYWYEYDRNDLKKENPFSERDIEIAFGSSYEKDIDDMLQSDTNK